MGLVTGQVNILNWWKWEVSQVNIKLIGVKKFLFIDHSKLNLKQKWARIFVNKNKFVFNPSYKTHVHKEFLHNVLLGFYVN